MQTMQGGEIEAACHCGTVRFRVKLTDGFKTVRRRTHLERARDRVAAAERRIDNERLNIPHRGRAGVKRAQRELSVIEAQLRLRGLLE